MSMGYAAKENDL